MNTFLHPTWLFCTFQVIVEKLHHSDGPVFLRTFSQDKVSLTFVIQQPCRTLQATHSQVKCTALFIRNGSSWSLCNINKGVCILSASRIAELARYLSFASHKVFPIRLCVSSYIKYRGRPLPLRIPKYPVTISVIGAAILAQVKRSVFVTKYDV